MSPILRATIPLTAALTLAVGIGYYALRSQSITGHNPPSKQHATGPEHLRSLPENTPLTRSRNIEHKEDTRPQSPQNALANERILRFQTDATYQRFLASLDARGLTLLGHSDHLRTARIGLHPHSDLDGIDGAEVGYNYLVTLPTPPDATAQANATGFGSGVLSWLGVASDNSTWGQGVTVAVIDSGVNEHVALQGNITRIELTELTAGSQQSGHGTAVASIISGDHKLTRGVAPASDIVSIRITDETGTSNSFTLAEGIIKAVDSGADIINISMGSSGNSQMVEEAVQYAKNQGSVIVAASGNEGVAAIAYPAAYDGVISVGAVEQSGEHLNFSNSGATLDITAPGYQINAAWGNDLLTAFSGTSASAPMVSGAIAAGMSEHPDMSAAQVADLVLKLSNDAGAPGSDPDYGGGILNLGRLMNYGTAGIYDAAVTGQVIVSPEFPTGLPEVLVTVQNQGTETLINSPVTITTASGNTKELNISSLAPGDIQTFKLPVLLPHDGAPLTISTNVQSVEQDSNPSNNSRSTQFRKEP